MPTLVRHGASGRWPPLVGPGTARDFVWVDDACDAFIRAASTPLADRGAVLNIASGTQTTLAALVATARDVFGVQADPEWGSMPARSWDTSTWVGDPSSAAHVLGWRTSTPLDQGLERMAAWFTEHPELAARYDG